MIEENDSDFNLLTPLYYLLEGRGERVCMCVGVYICDGNNKGNQLKVD